MISQNLTSPPILKNNLSDGSDNIFSKCKNEGKDNEKCDDERVLLKNSKNGDEESIVQWKPRNIKDGFVIVDEAQLTKLIKREPMEKYYKLEKEPFATGVFASVRKCQSLATGENYAAKFTSRDRYGEDCSAEIYHEIALLSLCGSAPRVIQIHDVFENPEEIIIVMEYAPGGDLQTIIDENLVPFESDVMSFIKQTVEGLEYLHRRRIAHLDIKPQNIVMMGDYPNCEIKLCDFEISRVILEGDDIRELLGTPDYVAPEILHYDPITLASDMWSLGVTTYVLLTGFSPFGGETDQETFCNISKAELDFPEDLFKDVSNEAIDFIKSLLVKNPRARLTASECLKHPWLNQRSKELKENHLEVNNKDDKDIKEEIYKTRNGCETCESQKKESMEFNCQNSLRKYLSKSREALFDKVIEKHNNNNNNNNNNIKKPTMKNHRFRKTRLCESQISLLSKSRERLINGETLNTPSRSIEKLYGLRSLSKSQEVLNLYKNGGLLASQENLNKVSEIIRSRENLMTSTNDGEIMKEKKLIRARTADLSILHQKHKPSRMYSCSSTTSLASFTNNMLEDEEEDEKNERINGMEENEKEATKSLKEPSTDEKSAFIKEIEELEEKRNQKHNLDREGDEEEPRYTVAQLITAYNKHQEIVTKTSLEVTMSAQEKRIKIPPIIQYNSKSSFPTGPTALRLFIPDIDVIKMPKKFTPKYKMRFPESTEEQLRNPLKEFNNSKLSLEEESLNYSIKDSKSLALEEPVVLTQKDKKKFEENKIQNSTPCQRRSKSTSPSIEINKESIRKYSGCLDYQKLDEGMKKKSPTPPPKVSVCSSRSSSGSRKPVKVEKSPASQRKTGGKTSKADEKKIEPPRYKIVGIGEKNLNSNRKSSGVSYKIEFDSPVVTRKFPVRNSPTKGTISSNLKVKEHPNRTKK